MEQSTENLGRLLHDAARSLRRAVGRRIEPDTLTSAQGRLLFVLARYGAVTQARLADALEIEPISVSRLVDRMEAGGWVERHPDPQDRRAKLVRATERGRIAHTEIKLLAGAVYAEALATLPTEARNILLNGLAEVITNLNRIADVGPEGVAET